MTVGVALGLDRVVVVVGDSGSPSPGGSEGKCGRWSSSADSFEDSLRTAFDEIPAGSRLHVALLPDVVEVRSIRHPPMDDRALRTHLARRGDRYLPAPPQERIVGIEGGRKREGPTWVAFAPTGVVEAIFRAAADRDLEVASVVPAVWVWPTAVDREGVDTNGVDTTGKEMGGRSGRVVRWPTTDGDDAVLHWIDRHEDGAFRYRRFPDSEAGRRALIRAGSGDEGRRQAPETHETPEDLTLEAARRAPAVGSRAPRLVPEPVRESWRRRDRRVTAVLAAAVLVLLVFTAVAHRIGLQRELAAVGAERARIEAAVSEAVSARARLEGLEGAFRVLRSLEARGPRWSELVAGLAESLPRTAYLTSMRGSADTVVVEGVAEVARSAVGGMGAVPGIRNLEPVGPVRREALGDDRPVERFTLRGTLDWSSRLVRADGAAASIDAATDEGGEGEGGAPGEDAFSVDGGGAAP